MKIRPGTNIFRKVLLRAFLWMRENTRNKIANLRVPPVSKFSYEELKLRSDAPYPSD